MKDPVRLLRRIAVTVAGTVILAVGLVLLVAPGPGLVVIALALRAAASRVATAFAVLFGMGNAECPEG